MFTCIGTAVHQVISCFPANWIVCYPPLIGYLTDCPDWRRQQYTYTRAGHSLPLAAAKAGSNHHGQEKKTPSHPTGIMSNVAKPYH
jgi:hypothetical protein